MAKEMLINVSEGEECRIAVLEDGRLEELYTERTSSTSHVGNIYKGKVTNVEPSIQAAFVDFGMGRNGFLHISDLLPQYFGNKGDEITEAVGRKLGRRDRPPIQRCLRRGDEIVVQIIKEGIGTKGPTLSTYLSIPGRILVMMPGMAKMGISRKIEDEAERKRLRQILDSLKPPKDVGFIIRTAGVGKTKAEIERDLKYLTRLWENIEKKRDASPAPVELYTEGDLVTRTVRDVFSSDVTRIVVDNKEVAKRVKEFIKISAPRTKNRVELYDDPIPLFHKYGIEREIELMHARYVPLPSGGSLVIDSTEAIVAIDVNSGKFREHNDAEMTAFKTDMEAADEICRQLKLRDLGGVIICDFIDLRYERHRRELEKRLQENFKKDRAKTKVLRMSQFGIIEMTRQRMRPSLKRSVYFDCPHCKGAGLVKTPESMSLDVMRRLAIAMNDDRVQRVEIAVCADVAYYLQNRKRAAIAKMEADNNKQVIIKVESQLALDEVRFDLYDIREGLVFLEELGMISADAARGNGNLRQGRQQQQQQRRRQQRSLPSPAEAEVSAEDLFEQDDLDETIEAGEERQDQKRFAEQEYNSDNEAVNGTLEGEADRDAEASAASEGRKRRRRRRGGRGRRQSDSQNGQAEETAKSADTQADEAQVDEAPADQAAVKVAPEQKGDQPEPVDATAAVSEEAQPQDAASAEADASADAESASTAPAEGQPKKRRRGRRGGRGRRKTAASVEVAADQPAEEQADDTPSAAEMPQADAKADTSSSSDEAPAEAAEAAPAATKPAKSPRKATERSAEKKEKEKPQKADKPSNSPPVILPPMPVVRTGSTDRHLADDEEIAPSVVSRPRTYRDLDAIPDDYD